MNKVIKNIMIFAAPMMVTTVLLSTNPMHVSAKSSDLKPMVPGKVYATDNTTKEELEKAQAQAKKDLSPEAIKARQEEHRQYLKQDADYDKIMRALGKDPYAEYSIAQSNENNKIVSSYEDVYGVPGSNTPKKVVNNDQKAFIDSLLKKAINDKKSLIKINQAKLKQVTKVLKLKHVKSSKYSKAVKKQKNLKNKIASLQKFIKTTESTIK